MRSVIKCCPAVALLPNASPKALICLKATRAVPPGSNKVKTPGEITFLLSSPIRFTCNSTGTFVICLDVVFCTVTTRSKTLALITCDPFSTTLPYVRSFTIESGTTVTPSILISGTSLILLTLECVFCQSENPVNPIRHNTITLAIITKYLRSIAIILAKTDTSNN
ncbi:hypothetical protein DSOL_0296 [Desulfosporosinus metallidurans]|uniref:Uncharacterized protein n=1 Tax=Desulfosporosinus metallidurans TaxID=1888891 RepID=A0A1Q8R1V8_9FIRM|nr:hypothetical protein DSOL_0296 [Desulfosporosinus metallidurans]